MEVVCQVRGEIIREHPDHGGLSDIWDVVKVPKAHANQWAIADAQKPNAKIGSAQNAAGEVEAIFAFRPNIWSKEEHRGIIEQLDTCDGQQNPAGYPPVK